MPIATTRNGPASKTPLIIRPAELGDAAALATIYAHHVLHGTATFEEVPPGEGEMAARLSELRAGGYPWLVAEDDDGLSGYAYLGPHKVRSAYRFTAEDSVYVAPERTGRGIGTALLGALLSDAERLQRFATVMAVIGDSANAASIALHRKHGFELIGTAKGLGYKFGRFIDVVYMQRWMPDGPRM